MRVTPNMSPAEIAPTPEAQYIANIVETAEADIRFHGLAGRADGADLEGACGKHSEILSFYARRQHVPSGVYQVYDMHRTLAGEDMYTQAFGHGVTIMHVGETVFLGDPTFGQFTTGETVKQFDPCDTGVPADDPFVQEIVTNGFVELTDENLRNYLRATTAEGPVDLGYIDTATTLGTLAIVSPRTNIEYSDEEISNGVVYHLPKSCADVSCERVLPEAMPLLPQLPQ